MKEFINQTETQWMTGEEEMTPIQKVSNFHKDQMSHMFGLMRKQVSDEYTKEDFARDEEQANLETDAKIGL